MILENRYRKINWILVTNSTKSNLGYLNKQYGIDNEDLELTLPPLQRPRLSVRDDYLIMILQYPYYNAETQEIRSSEIDFFIGKNFLITVSDGNLPKLNEFFDTIEDDPKAVAKNSRNDLGNLLYELLSQHLFYLYPMLDTMSQDLDTLEDEIMAGLPIKGKTINDILRMKTNIVSFRKAMQSHKPVINRLIENADDYFTSKKLIDYFENLVNHTTEVWTTLSHYQDTIDALHETYKTFVDFHTNQVIKTLTFISVIVFPLTLLAAIFGMNTRFTPLVEHPQGFWIIIIFMLAGVVAMWSFFKYKKWM